MTHEVLPKQTLYSLSRQYGVSVDELIANNPESKSGLTVGMLLKIPVKTPQVTKQTVKAPVPTPPVVTKPAPKVEKEEKAKKKQILDYINGELSARLQQRYNEADTLEKSADT